VVLALLGVGALGVAGYLQYVKEAGSRCSTPEEVVLRSFDCLRCGDIEGLRSCYTEDAWKTVARTVVPTDAGEAATALREQMAAVEIVRCAIVGTTADGVTMVEATIREQDGATDTEVFETVQTGDGWRIR